MMDRSKEIPPAPQVSQPVSHSAFPTPDELLGELAAGASPRVRQIVHDLKSSLLEMMKRPVRDNLSFVLRAPKETSDLPVYIVLALRQLGPRWVAELVTDGESPTHYFVNLWPSKEVSVSAHLLRPDHPQA